MEDAVMNHALPAEAMAAWQAYHAMVATKRHHFDYLSRLEEKYSQIGQPDDQEKAQLRTLLNEHDERVNAFKAQVNRLKVKHPKAYGALVMRLAAEASD
jgi:hypothetical protein